MMNRAEIIGLNKLSLSIQIKDRKSWIYSERVVFWQEGNSSSDAEAEG